ncbi:histidine kinase [Sporosarcina sp. FSL W7-1349]|uniref:sensor histidine kinase n=1 Tax=Sporosarcina sp. FSL W7-1349 TaxID=2921561 RepID=UPI0030F716D9
MKQVMRMISYEQFFLIIIVSILGPVVSLLGLIFFQLKETEVNLLEIQNNRVLLEKELETSKYYQLSQQIQPHFLFNALNSLLSLLKLQKYEKLTEGFEHMVLFLRYKYKVHDHLYPISEEVMHTTHYLQIQQIRFGNRLSIDIEVEEQLHDEMIIPFLLQTVVENAFKHGIEEVEGGSSLIIRITEQGDTIFLQVIDEGPGILGNQEVELGTGLKNIIDRLRLIYGTSAHFSLENRKETRGAIVTVSWPRHYMYGEEFE